MSQIGSGYLGRSSRLIPKLLRDPNGFNVPWIAVIVSAIPVVFAYMKDRDAPIASRQVCSRRLTSNCRFSNFSQIWW